MFLHPRKAHVNCQWIRWIPLVVLLCCLDFLTGCVTEYQREDIEDYLKEQGIRHYTLSQDYEVVEDAEGYDDRYWTVTTDYFGFDEPLTFHVIDDYYWGLETTSNRLVDDRENVIMEAIRQRYKLKGDLTYGADATSSLEEGIENNYGFVYPVRSKADFPKVFSEIQEVQNFLKDYPHIATQRFPVEYRFPIREEEAGKQTDHLLEQGRYTLWFTAETSREELEEQLFGSPEEGKEGIQNRYLDMCLTTGLRDRVDEFTEEEIEGCIAIRDLVEVRDENEQVLLPRIVYRDSFSGEIAYGNLFELAKTQGLTVTGTWWEFTVRGADGVGHAFAYGDEDPFVDIDQASHILGVSLDDGAAFYDVVIDEDVLEKMGMTGEEMVDYLGDRSEKPITKVEVKGGEVHWHAKTRQLSEIIRANEQEMDQRMEQVRDRDERFYYSIRRVNRDYEGIDLYFTWPKQTLPAKREQIDQIISLGYLNQRLARPGETEPFGVCFYEYQENDKDSWDSRGTWQEVKSYMLPGDSN